MRWAPRSSPVVGSAMSLHTPVVSSMAQPYAVSPYGLDVGDVGAPLLDALLLGQPDGRDLGVAEDPRAARARAAARRRSSGCARLCAMVRASRVGDVLELVGGADVAEGPDAGGARAPVVVDLDPSVVEQPQAAGVGAEVGRVGLAAGRDEEEVGIDDRRCCRGGGAPPLPRRRARRATTLVPVRTSHCSRARSVKRCAISASRWRSSDRRPRQDRHVHAERREDVRHLGGDEAAADDREPFGQRVDAHDRVGGVEGHAGLGDDVGHDGVGAGGDDDLVGGQRLLAAVAEVDRERAVAGEARMAEVGRRVGSLDAVAPPPSEMGSMRPKTRSRTSVQRTPCSVASTP